MSDQKPEFEVWNPYEEELYCLVVITDEVGEKILKEDYKGQAYVRGFVMKNRKTGEPRAIWRFHQPSGKSWYQVSGKPVEELRDGLMKCFTMACELMQPPIKLDDPNPVKVFYPPQGGTGDDQIVYLLQNDLVEITSIDEVKVQ